MISWGALKQTGILGLNRRNIEYIARYNKRRLYPLVDDKVNTKELAARAGMAVPELYFVLEIQHQVRELPELLAAHTDFVIKPASGSGGEGVTVFTGRMKDCYRTSSGELFNADDLAYYVTRVLAGVFSLGGQPDKVLCEYRVKYSSLFEKVTYLGVPDVRIVLFQGVPVMSMVRLPTRMSKGKANLHQGAIGAGIDLATGRTLKAVWQNRIVDEHPDTGHPVAGLQLPNWPELLRLAARCYDLTGLGYLGADIVLDAERGPLLLELNARPGLNIQLANCAGLLPRLQCIEGQKNPPRTLEERVDFARQHFGTHRTVHLPEEAVTAL